MTSGNPSARWFLLVGVTASLWAAFAWLGLTSVPFHPDETSMLFESRDLELLFRNPTDLVWQPDIDLTPALEYRLLNAPLAKYAVGIARRLAGTSDVEVDVDWDWSRDWESNLSSGAMPPRSALLAGRAASLVMMAMGGVALGAWAYRFSGRRLLLLVALSYGLSAFQLLHGRRAMAEGAVLGTVSLWLYATAHLRSKPWLLGLASGLSLSAKHSTLPLLAVGLLGALAIPLMQDRSWARSLRSGAMFTVPAVAVFFLLNPVLWAHPGSAAREAIRLRAQLVARQSRELGMQLEGSTLRSPIERAAAATGLLFVTDLQFQEVGNYRRALESSISEYRSIPGHRIDRGLVAGAVRLILVGVAGVLLLRRIREWETWKSGLGLILLGASMQAVALVAFNPLPFQRYYTPLLPFVHALTGWALLVPLSGVTSREW